MTRRPLFALLFAVANAAAVLAQEVPSQKAAIQQVREIQKVVEEMRGLSFQVPVKVGLKTPDEIRSMVMESFEKEAPAEEMAKQEKVYKALGLIPADYDLRARMIDFLAENIGGYYDPEKKELFLVDMSKNEALQGAPGMQGMMEGMVMAHELNHALQDQNFDLQRWFDVLGDHEDRVQGYKSLVEGEAQLVGMTYMFGKMGRGKVDIKQMNRMQEMALRMSPEGAKIRAIPPFLVENMMFPYTQGAEFVQDIQRRSGWEPLTAGYFAPPSSTEQVLHPEKFINRDEPVELSLPGLAFALAEGSEQLYQNTLGEFNVSVLLRAHGVAKQQAEAAACGWDGDTYRGFQTPDGRVVIVWLSTWDSEDEAARFEKTFRAALDKRGARADELLERRGTEVLLVRGSVAGPEREALVRRGFGAVRSTMTFEPLPAFRERPVASDFTGERGSVAAAAPAPAALLHHDGVRASLLPPAGYQVGKEPLDRLAEVPSLYLSGPGGVELRVLALPLPLAQAKEELQKELTQAVKEFTLEAEASRAWGGRPGLVLQFTGKLPGASAANRTRVQALARDGDTLALAVTVPAGGDAEGALEAALRGLWVDGGIEGLKAARQELGGVSLDVPEGFVASAGQGPVLCTLTAGTGAKVVVVRAAATGPELDGAALEQQLRLAVPDCAVNVSGTVQRGGKAVHELEFEVGGRRTRQWTLQDGDQRYSVACSAPVERFAELQPVFARVLGSFRVGAGAAPQSPGTEQKDRRVY